ncbi:hypothetical protein G6M84_12020 [Agrobacterium tumefaciens]|nr:hypothetical protein [Agrobacterium tumefaciens]NTC47460.1 hypothetical protein [Agrobacterium tumefaciens]
MNWLENLRRSFLDWNAMAEVLPTMITVGLKNTLILAADTRPSLYRYFPRPAGHCP